MFRFSTKFKVALGFITLLLLILVSIILVYHEISTLKTNDEHELMHIDSVKVQLLQKEKRMNEAIKSLKELEQIPEYESVIHKKIQTKDTTKVKPIITKRTTTVTQQYAVPKKKKKGFFKKLHDLFTHSKPDTTHVAQTVVTEVFDTIHKSVGNKVSNVKTHYQTSTKANVQHEQRIKQLNQHVSDLKAGDEALNNQVVQLIKEIESEDSLLSHQQAENMQEIRHNSAQALGWIAITALLLAGVFLFIIWRDINKEDHYRKQLEKANKETSRLLTEREQLMLTVTHDIKAPLGSILGYADLLKRITKDERQIRYLNNMKASGQHLLRMVTSLLDFHQLDEHKIEIEMLSFQPIQLFTTIYQSFLPLAEKKGIQLIYKHDGIINRSYKGDAFRIRQIVENLLSNALKFTPKGSIRMTVNIKNTQLHFSVNDTGLGIPKNEQQKIFQEFTRLSNAQGQEGFGLGLSITLKLVQLMNGEITVESEPGKGTAFNVFLPLQIIPEHEIKKCEDSTPAKALRLLMIDDDPLQLQLTEAMLKHQNIKITTCLQPLKLLSLLQHNKYDAVITDIQMPAMNGFELIKKIQETGISIPVYALTARSDIHASELRKHGFAGCLHKPFTAEELEATVSNIPQEEKKNDTEINSKPKGLNFSAFLAFSGDDKEATRNILQTFISETQKSNLQIADALKKGDTQTITSLAHKMLPVFIQIGDTKGVPALTKLEKQRDKTQIDEMIKEETETVLDASEEVINAAKDFLQNL